MPTLAEKIMAAHSRGGDEGDVGLAIDQTLTQDATGTMAYLQFEALGLPRVRTRLSVSYVDHNTLQADYMNADDHRYLQSAASKYGVLFSRPGNGICHQVHLERFAKPGETLLGSDSHTPTAGGMGMLAIGAGGLDVALAMAGQPFMLKKPQVVGIRLTGRLRPWVSAKDVILEVLRRLGVKGGVGKIVEYFGPGVATLTVPERATIANMGAELGATSSIFPSDARTKKFLAAQGRAKDWARLEADGDAKYSWTIEIDLSSLAPLIACPHSPGKVAGVSGLEGLKVDQVCIGSCTNSSLKDMMAAAALLKGRAVHPGVSLTVSPGSRQVLAMMAKNGSLAALVAAGARILESACGPCIGMGQAPPSGGVSVRTFNRNFEGRSGTRDALVYLSSVETAVAAAVKGRLTDPRKLGRHPALRLPEKYMVDDGMIIRPSGGEAVRGPNIKPLPVNPPLPGSLEGEALIKVGDDISTDHIMPAGAKVLPLRSNIPAISEYVFSAIDPSFPKRAREKGGGFVVGGANYGQGSSREHAALAPMHLGVKAVIAKSFARIHKANLVNFGIIPLEFADPKDYDAVTQGDRITIDSPAERMRSPEFEIEIAGRPVRVRHDLTERQRKIIEAGGLLNLVKKGL
jgi:aconitate hydratase